MALCEPGPVGLHRHLVAAEPRLVVIEALGASQRRGVVDPERRTARPPAVRHPAEAGRLRARGLHPNLDRGEAGPAEAGRAALLSRGAQHRPGIAANVAADALGEREAARGRIAAEREPLLLLALAVEAAAAPDRDLEREVGERGEGARAGRDVGRDRIATRGRPAQSTPATTSASAART